MSAPTLAPEVLEQLSRVPTSRDGSMLYAPCIVTLKSGEVLPRVYVLEESSYLRLWGDDPNRTFIDPGTITSIAESPDRLPAELANEVYAAGESGMGYSIFTVVLRDARTIPFLTGNAVDFPDWPEDVDPSDAVAVQPHVGREHFQVAGEGRRSASSVSCLYRV